MWTYPAVVRRVVDGDTLILDLDMGLSVWRLGERCRLQGIDAPELDTIEGQQARAFLAGLLTPQGRPSEVTFHSRKLDKWGCPLGYVMLPTGQSLADLLLASGHATEAA